MKELTQHITIQVLSYDELNSAQRELVERAKEMTQQSYSPYSHFRVGAAVRLSSGDIVTGANQENVAYPSGLCAERVALFAAGASFPQESVLSVAIAAWTNGHFTASPVTPCGACRQVMAETAKRQQKPVEAILYGEKECYVINDIKDLLPLTFDIE